MSAAEPSLFPTPSVPVEARAELQTAATAVRLAHREFVASLSRGSVGNGQWSEPALAEVAALIAIAKSLHERAEALLLSPVSGLQKPAHSSPVST